MDLFSELLQKLNLLDVGASGLLVIVVLMILTGKLVPKSQVDQWKDLYYEEREAGNAVRQQNSALIQSGKVTVRVLDSLPIAPGGDSDVEATTETRRSRRKGGDR